jgi:hypothetical protein
MQVFRVFGNDKFADIRLKVGKVADPVPEPADGNQTDIDQLGIDTSQVVYELLLAKNSFQPESGAPADKSTRDQVAFKFFFDRNGGAFLRAKGGLFIGTKKRLHVEAKEGMQFTTDKDITFKAAMGVTIDAGGGATHIKGAVVRLGPGSKPVATQGSMVQMSIPYTPLPIPGSPPLVLFGTIVTGTSSVLA